MYEGLNPTYSRVYEGLNHTINSRIDLSLTEDKEVFLSSISILV